MSRPEPRGAFGGGVIIRRKKSKLKDRIRPRWGLKKRKRFWLPPKKDLLSVGWSFRISISTGEVKVQFQREK